MKRPTHQKSRVKTHPCWEIETNCKDRSNARRRGGMKREKGSRSGGLAPRRQHGARVTHRFHGKVTVKTATWTHIKNKFVSKLILLINFIKKNSFFSYYIYCEFLKKNLFLKIFVKYTYFLKKFKTSTFFFNHHSSFHLASAEPRPHLWWHSKLTRDVRWTSGSQSLREGCNL